MRIGLSIFLIAAGAVLRFALETSVDGIDLGMTGVILMVVGALGLVISLFFFSSLSPSRRQSDISSGEVVRETETVSTGSRAAPDLSTFSILHQDAKDALMAIVIILFVLALLLGGVGLFAEGLKWVLIIALVLFVANFFSYRGSHR